MRSKNGLLIAMAVAVLAFWGCGSGTDTAQVNEVNQDAVEATAPITEVAVPGDTDEAQPPAPVSAAEALDLPDVVARVGDETITGEEFGRQIQMTEQMMAAQGRPLTMTEEQRGEFLNDMVDSKLLEMLAQKSGATPSDEEVEAYINQAKSQMPPGQYEQVLAAMGMTEEQFRDNARTTMTSRKYIDDLFKDITVTDEDLTTEYEILKTTGQIDRPEDTVDVAHILIRVAEDADEAAWEAAKADIDAAYKRVKENGEPFADVAKEVSEDPGSAEMGGLMTDMSKGRLVPEFDERMFDMEIGAVSEPFKTQFGWHILTVVKKNAAGTMSFDETKDGLRQMLLSERQQKAVRDKVEEARESTTIEILYPAEDQASPETDEEAGAPETTPAPEDPAVAESPASEPADPDDAKTPLAEDSSKAQ